MARTPWMRTPVNRGVLDLWIPPTVGDPVVEVEVRPEEEFRPDLLATRLWGDPNAWWIFAMSDPDAITDPIRDLRAGVRVRVPRVPPSS